MREIITLQVGQCGNQIARDYWELISKEHGINLNGECNNKIENDRKDIFFYQADDGRYVPRGIAIDLEPRVVNSVISSTPFFNQENVFVSEDGCGAGNNWADGYFSAKKNFNEIYEIIQREAENSDFLDGFFLMHSIAGGTGSGCGSFILEELRQEFPKKIIQTYSILPNNNEVSDVVVQPYNSVLSLQRLALCCDLVCIMDNNALGKIALDSLRIKTPTFNHINSLISTAMAASTSTLRFPTYTFSDLSTITHTLTPSPT
ncbi:Gamma tubulin, partial [Spraguea lophii 42_110]